jgi:hypothetical protein
MATTDLLVGIGAEYRGKAAFKKADKDIFGLNKAVKTLAKGYLGLQGAQKAFAYASSSVKAFAQDDKAARQLSKTVGNLGLAYEATNVENFIQGLEKTYHVNDDLLRPSFAKLIQVTQSYTKSKELLTTALDASAGAGVDLTTTVQDLSQAYVGNLRGLRKYNLGLTQAELAGMTFEQILSKINNTFSGQASLAADTYSGKLDALTIAATNAKETIGKGLVDALTTAAGKRGDIDGLVKDIETLASAAADTARFFGTIFGFLGKIVSLTDKITPGYQAAQAKKNKALNAPYDPMSGTAPVLGANVLKTIAQRAKADALSAQRQKDLIAATAKQTKLLKEQTALAKAKAVLDQASAVMNLDLIQNTAALQGKITADETLRLKLQQAILLGNSVEAGNLAQQLLATQAAAVKLSATNPLGGFSDAIKAALQGIYDLRTALEGLGAAKATIPVLSTNTTIQGYVDAILQSPGAANSYTNAYSNPAMNYQDAFARPNAANSYNNVVISIDPSAAAYGISAAVVSNAANGNSNSFNRNGLGM